MRNVRGGIFKRRWRHKDARVLIDCCMVLAEETAVGSDAHCQGLIVYSLFGLIVYNF
jgi:hypothetical protein